MADYSSFKVPDLKKLLTERGLATTGNKPDLIKRLKDNDEEQKGPSDGAEAAGTYPGSSLLSMCVWRRAKRQARLDVAFPTNNASELCSASVFPQSLHRG